MKILLITPVKTEYHAARETFSARETASPESGKSRLAKAVSRDLSIYILMTGIGFTFMKNIDEFLGVIKPDLIIDSGSCGSLNDSFLPGMIVMAVDVVKSGKEIIKSSEDVGFFRQYGQYYFGRMLEVSRPVTDPESRKDVQRMTEADICSMEAYSVAAMAEKSRITWVSLRIVTDMADRNTKESFKKLIRQYSLILYENIYSVLKKSLLKEPP